MIRILHRSIAKYPIDYFSSPRNTSAIQGIQLRNDVQPECQKEKKKKKHLLILRRPRHASVINKRLDVLYDRRNLNLCYRYNAVEFWKERSFLEAAPCVLPEPTALKSMTQVSSWANIDVPHWDLSLNDKRARDSPPFITGFQRREY